MPGPWTPRSVEAPCNDLPCPRTPTRPTARQVLDDVEAEASEVVEYNPWLTYGEPLHRAREFGVCVSAIDRLNERLLSRQVRPLITHCAWLVSDAPLIAPSAGDQGAGRHLGRAAGRRGLVAA